MTRKRGLEIEVGFYHLITRGVDRQRQPRYTNSRRYDIALAKGPQDDQLSDAHRQIIDRVTGS